MIKSYTLKNKSGMEVEILNLGAVIKKINFKGKNLVLYNEDNEKYINDPTFKGAVIGPTAGRIKDSKFKIYEKEAKLVANEKNNANHGGKINLSSKIFNVLEKQNSIELTYSFKNEGGHIGNIDFKVVYSLNDDNIFKIDLFAESDSISYVNMTNHSYFNLAGIDSGISGLEQYLKIDASTYCKLDTDLIPTGEKVDVSNTCFDFRKARKIKEAFEISDEQFEITKGIDHAFVLDKGYNCLSLYSKESKIKMDISTTQKVIVIYSGNFLEEKYKAIAIEPQNYQNGINTLGFDFELCSRQNPYHHEIEYSFKEEQ